MAEPTGTQLGAFRIESVLGSGGFATVYRATDERFGDTVAIKVLAENHSLHPEIRSRFLGEAHVLRRIKSDAVVRVSDVGETSSGQPYFVLDHAERGDLRARVAEHRAGGGQVTAGDLVIVVRALSEALVAIHAEDVVHRDITPSNVLIKRVSSSRDVGTGEASIVRPDEQLVVADLGHAKDLALHSGLTVGGGTHGFSAPEQRQGVSMVTSSADIYAATALIVWLALDEPPGLRAVDEVCAHLSDNGHGDEFVEQVRIGLSLDPADRHESAADWRAGFLDALPAETASSHDPSTGEHPTRKVAMGAVLAVLVLVAVTVAVVLLRGDGMCANAADGRVLCTLRLDDGAVRMSAPRSMSLDERAVVSVDADAGLNWVLYGPDGAAHPNVDSIVLTANSPGRAQVTLVVTRPGEDPLVIRHDFDVKT